MGAEGKFDLCLAASHDPDKLQKNLAAVKGSAGAVGGAAKAKETSKSKVRFFFFFFYLYLYLIYKSKVRC